MASTNILPNMLVGNTQAVNNGMLNMGVPPVGNAGGSTLPGPTGANAIATAPVGAMPRTAGTPTPAGSLLNLSGSNAISPANDTNLSNQLNNIYGKGVGGEIYSTEQNLGSNNSSYMQAYEAAQAQPNAEGLATLNTTLGNSGVSANSSTAAIADADYQTGIVAQEGLQEQQLQQTDIQDLIGLETSTEGAANKQASTSVWGDIGGVLGSIGSDLGGALPGSISALGDAGLL